MSGKGGWLVQKLVYGLFILPVLALVFWLADGNDPPGLAAIGALVAWQLAVLAVMRAIKLWPFN